MAEETSGKDYVLRALTNDGSFRVIAARTTETVRGAIQAQSARGITAQHFGELLTGAILVRETMAPTQRVQMALRGAGSRGSLVADAHPKGLTRGLVNIANDSNTRVLLGKDSMLQVSRSFPSGSLHQGVVRVPEEGGISAGLMGYMQSSEQVVSMVSVACEMSSEREVLAAGGYIVQVLPEVDEDSLRVMIERLERFKEIRDLVGSSRGDPEKVLETILEGVEYTKLEKSPVYFGCTCNPIRVVASLATLGREEVAKIVSEKRVVDVTCDYCGAAYAVGPEQLKPLIAAS